MHHLLLFPPPILLDAFLRCFLCRQQVGFRRQHRSRQRARTHIFAHTTLHILHGRLVRPRKLTPAASRSSTAALRPRPQVPPPPPPPPPPPCARPAGCPSTIDSSRQHVSFTFNVSFSPLISSAYLREKPTARQSSHHSIWSSKSVGIPTERCAD